ncbi:hypothetical protein Ae201684_015339 [Aphanomyces euteiches]|uniref:Rab-GAP TBC domain-containing protein n=1 Tax=Aphanomyces euteiches TaxID=100861 RepID=A0A6G0WH25_9STRA|nr:hypothetical protein Ae201684_015339 [Aphanomyces euteiches]KAH9153804.1 hypothetical protein AeRB84_004004 [Aphanomyces euteiches]
MTCMMSEIPQVDEAPPRTMNYWTDLRRRVDDILLTLPSPTSAGSSVQVHFGSGFLGLGFCLSTHSKYSVAIQDFPTMEDGTLGAAAFYNEATVDPALKLVPGHLLTHINDADLQNVAYTEVLDRVEAAERPIKLGFMAPPNRFDSALRLRRQSSVSHPPPTKEASSVAFRVFNAIQYGHFLSVLELQTKIDFNWKYPTDQRNLLHFAARYKEINATKWLLRRENGRALVQERSIQGRYPMHDAISGGNLAISTQIYELFPQAIHEGDAKGVLCVHLAAGHGHTALLSWLVERGASPSRASFDGKTSLHYAASRGHIETVVYLIRGCHIDATAVDSHQCTALHYAARNGHFELCQWLIFHTLIPPMKLNTKLQAAKDLVPPNQDETSQFLQLVSAVPPTPMDLVATSLPDSLAIHIQWSVEPTKLEILWTQIQYFELFFAVGYIGEWQLFPVRLDATCRQCLVPNCLPNTDYSLRIRAVNHNGASPFTKVALRTLQDPNPQGYFLSVNLAEIRHLPGENAATRYFIVVKIAPGMTYRSKLGTLQEKFALDTQSFRHPKFDFKVPVLDAFQSIDVDIFAVQNLESTLLTSFSCNISAKDGIQWVPLNCQGQGEALVITNDDEIQEITDAFGFQLPSSHLKRYVVASRLAKCVETYHELSWKRLVDQILQNELDIESRCEMEALIWNGVPAAWRSTVYFFASGAAALQSQHESTYYLSLEAKFDSSPDKKLIDADVKRTFADQPFMETSRPALERVLLAFTVHMPDVGYCQSMNFIAARLLVVLPEEQTFWVLVILCGQKFSKYYLRTLQGVHVDGSVLEALMQSRLPRLIHHCHLLDTPVEILAAQWFLPLFCQTFPASTTFRLLDCILVHDSSVVFALVLAHLRLASPGLLKTKDYMAFTNSLRQLEAGLYDVEHLLEMAAKEFHSLHVAVHQLRETQTHIENAKIENENPIQESSPHNSSFHKETNEAEPRIST